MKLEMISLMPAITDRPGHCHQGPAVDADVIRPPMRDADHDSEDDFVYTALRASCRRSCPPGDKGRGHWPGVDQVNDHQGSEHLPMVTPRTHHQWKSGTFFNFQHLEKVRIDTQQHGRGFVNLLPGWERRMAAGCSTTHPEQPDTAETAVIPPVKTWR